MLRPNPTASKGRPAGPGSEIGIRTPGSYQPSLERPARYCRARCAATSGASSAAPTTVPRYSGTAALTRKPCARMLWLVRVTLSLDDRVVTEARRIAASRGTSLNQLIRDFLNDLTRVDDVEWVIAQLDTLWAEERYRSRGPWTREELHDRQGARRVACG